MGVKQQADGTWHAFYSKRHPKTRVPVAMRRKAIKTKAEALKVEKELVLLVDDRLKAVIVPKWPVFVDQYLDFCRLSGMREKTLYNRDKCLKAATASWVDKFVDSITSNDIRHVVVVDYGDRSISQQKSILQYIRCAFEHACEVGIVQKNPAPNIAFKVGDKIKKVLNEEQVRILLNKAKALNWKWYPHYAVALYTGLRSGEMYALTWDKVDLNSRQILVDSSWSNKDGLKSTKSGNDRMVEIAPTLLPLLQELRLKSGGVGSVLERHQEWTDGRQAQELRRFQEGLGLPQTRFHDLRATWCTLMLSKGVEPIKVMLMGGWENMKTMQIYMRKAGVSIRGITDVLRLHDPVVREANVVNLNFGTGD
jgi:integrase